MKKYISSYYFQLYYLPALIFMVCFIWRFFYITERDICLDEPFTIYYAQKSVYDIILLTINGEPNPPLFMLLVHVWIKLFGISASALRLLPLFFGSLTLVFLFKSALKLSGIYAALTASLMFLFSSVHFYYSLEVRAYSLLSLLTSISYYLYITLIQDERKTWVKPWIIFTNICLIMTHYFGWFVIANQVFFLLFYFKNKHVRNVIVEIFAYTLLFSLPVIFITFRQFLVSTHTTWVQPPDKILYLNNIYLLLNNKYVFLFVVFTLLTAAIIHILNTIRRKTPPFGHLKDVSILLICFIVPYSFMFFISFKVPMFVDRYLLFNSIALYLFIGVAVGKLLFSFWYLELIACMAITIPFFENNWNNSKGYYYREVKNAITHVVKSKDNSTVIFLNPYWTDMEFSYYYNPVYFKTINKNRREIMQPYDIYPIDNLQNAIEVIKNKKNVQTIIFYTNGTDFENNDNRIPPEIINNYSLADSAFYPQCIRILVYKKNTY